MVRPVPDSYIQLGTLGKTFQLKGGLHFYPLGEAEAQAMFSVKQVWIDGVGTAELRGAKEMGSKIIVYLTRALTPEAARPLVNRDVYAAPDALPKRDADEIYIDELIGQAVFLNGDPYARVLDVIDADMQDILKIEAGSSIIMIPLQAPYVDVTDDGVYLANVPEGLLDLNT